jgi:PAS domain S-box-containing protein
MASQKHQDDEHEQILREMLEQFGPVFQQSPDGVYLYLDDRHKICNERLAKMFGLTTKEWSAAPNFLGDFVVEQDQEMVANNYQRHIAMLTRPVSFRFRALRKDGSTFNAETEMIPMSWRGNSVAYHFMREVK